MFFACINEVDEVQENPPESTPIYSNPFVISTAIPVLKFKFL